jgi:hypothetical protein
MLVLFKNRPACEGTDTEMWFTQGSGGYAEKDTLYRICNKCPAKAECLAYALEYEVIGFWGGTTENIRRQIRRERGIIAKPVLPEWELRSA